MKNDRAHRRAALPPQSHWTNGSFSLSAHSHFFFFLLPCQVFVDRQFVGVLDYETQELSVPEGKVTLTVIVSMSIYLYLYCMYVFLSFFLVNHQKSTFLALCLQSSAKILGLGFLLNIF